MKKINSINKRINKTMKLIDHLMNFLMIYMKIIIILINKYLKLLMIQSKIHFKNLDNY